MIRQAIRTTRGAVDKQRYFFSSVQFVKGFVYQFHIREIPPPTNKKFHSRASTHPIQSVSGP